MIEDSVARAEYWVCGAILNYTEAALRDLPDYLVPADFRDDACRAVFTAIRALCREEQAINPVSLQGKMEQLGRIASDAALQVMCCEAVTAAHVVQHAQTVHNAALKRRLDKVCEKIQNDSSTPLETILNALDMRVNQLRSLAVQKPLASCAAEFTYTKPKWLLEPYFQIGKGTLVQADPGVGKTAFMCAVAACVTTGKDLLGLPVQQPGNVLILSAEDDFGVLRGRLEANGADLNRVFLVNSPYSMTFSSPEIGTMLEQYNPRLVIFDPMQAFMGAKVDLFRANETRPILTALFDLCARHQCACTIIAHLGKNIGGKSAVNQSLGSVDIPGAMRSILHIVRHPTMEQLMAVHIKSSNAARGKTIAYSIGRKGSVNWLELTDDTLETLYSTSEHEKGQSEYDKNILLPVLLEMRDNNRQNCFWSYDELRDLCRKKLGYVPFKSSTELGSYLTRDFLHELEIRECLQVKTGQRYSGKRGLRLLTMPKIGDSPADETQHLSEKDYKELMSFLDQQEDWGMQQ